MLDQDILKMNNIFGKLSCHRPSGEVEEPAPAHGRAGGVAEEEGDGRLLLGRGQRGEPGGVVEQHHPLAVGGEERLEVAPHRARRQQSQDAHLCQSQA